MNEFREEDGHILINVPYAEAYIPVDLFTNSESSIAYFSGDAIKTMGIFLMRFFNSEDEADDRDNKKLRTLRYPNMIETRPTTFEKMHLTLNGLEDDYFVLMYNKDDILMESSSSKSILNCEAYLDALSKAKFPRTIDYQELLFMWLKNFKINAISPGTKAIIEQLIISELVRSTADPTKPYRKIAAKSDTINAEDYILFNMNNVSANTSVLSGIGFERVKEKLATGITMSKTGAKQSVSPVEQVMIM